MPACYQTFPRGSSILRTVSIREFAALRYIWISINSQTGDHHEQVAFVEPFDPSTNPEFKPDKEYKSRIVLLNRDVVLTDQATADFAMEHEPHLFAEDGLAVNRTITFKVETFEPTESFKPTKPYKTRLKWRVLRGEEQSKLLVTAPESVIGELLNGKAEPEPEPIAKRPKRRPSRGRNGSRRMEGFQT